MLEALLGFLGQFTATTIAPYEQNIVPFGIATLLWLLPFLFACWRWRQNRPGFHARESMLIIAFSFAIIREVLMMSVRIAPSLGIAPDIVHIFFPPLEQLLKCLSIVLIASAFIQFLLQDEALARSFLWMHGTIATVCFLISFWWWANYLTGQPEVKFGHVWCIWLFRLQLTMTLIAAVLIVMRAKSGWMRNTLVLAFAMFLLDLLCKVIVPIAPNLLNPIRNVWYLLAIPIFGYVYVRELLLENQRLFSNLTEAVEEKTSQLQEALKELESRNAELNLLSMTDGLTQVRNRRCFDNTLNAEWNRLSRQANPLSLLIIDADHFKKINDQYGHQVGDDCLKALAQSILACIERASDLVARYGGEEFVALLPNTSHENALDLAERIRSLIARTPISVNSESEFHVVDAPTNAGLRVHLTASIGVATASSAHPQGPAVLLQAADAALYAAKANGRNRVESAVAIQGHSLPCDHELVLAI